MARPKGTIRKPPTVIISFRVPKDQANKWRVQIKKAIAYATE